MKDKKVTYKYKGFNFTGIYKENGELQILVNKIHLCYIEINKYKEREELTESELFRAIIKHLCNENLMNVIREYFSRKEEII